MKILDILFRKNRGKVKCPACGEYSPKEMYELNWDWSGPHCPRCGHASMDLLGKITGPVQNARYGCEY